MRRDDGSDPGGRANPGAGQVTDIPVAAASVRWERPTARSFWNSLADPEREALAAAGVIADRTRVLGASHPDTVAIRNELAQAVAP